MAQKCSGLCARNSFQTSFERYFSAQLAEQLRISPRVHFVQQPALKKKHEIMNYPAREQIAGYEQLIWIDCPCFSDVYRQPQMKAVLQVPYVPRMNCKLLIKQGSKVYVTPAVVSSGPFEHQLVAFDYPLVIFATDDPKIAKILQLAYYLRENEVSIREAQELFSRTTTFKMEQFPIPRSISPEERKALLCGFPEYSDDIISCIYANKEFQSAGPRDYSKIRFYNSPRDIVLVTGTDVYRIRLALHVQQTELSFYAVRDLNIKQFEEFYLPGIIFALTGRLLIGKSDFMYYNFGLSELYDQFIPLPSHFLVRQCAEPQKFHSATPICIQPTGTFYKSLVQYEETSGSRRTVYKLGADSAGNQAYLTQKRVQDFPDISYYFQPKTSQFVDFRYPRPDILQYRRTPFAGADPIPLIDRLKETVEPYDYTDQTNAGKPRRRRRRSNAEASSSTAKHAGS